jgi:hypothetical protein
MIRTAKAAKTPRKTRREYGYGLAKNAKTDQANVQFNSLSTGGSIESLSDAEGQAKEAKNREGPRGR